MQTPSRWFGGDIRISQVPRKSAWGMPWSRDPGEFQHSLPCRRAGCCLPMLGRRRHSRRLVFGARYTACFLAVYASRSVSPRTTQDSLPADG